MFINAIALQEDWQLELLRIERDAMERAIKAVAIKQRGDALVDAARDMAKEAERADC